MSWEAQRVNSGSQQWSPAEVGLLEFCWPGALGNRLMQLLLTFIICFTLFISTPALHHHMSKSVGTMEPALSSF